MRTTLFLVAVALAGCNNFENGFKLINDECGPKYDGTLTVSAESGMWGQSARISCELPAGAKLEN